MNKSIVFPGEFIANQEEFLAGDGTFAEDGEVKAAAVGVVEKDQPNRVVSVKRQKLPTHLKVGDNVVGVVKQVSEKTAVITILPLPADHHRINSSQQYGILKVTDVRKGFVKSLEDEMKTGDFVVAKVTDISPGTVLLSVNSSDLGVVKAYCAECRHALVLEGEKLVCHNCKTSGSRKLASNYGEGGF